MKINNIIKVCVVAAVAVVTMSSCNDFLTIYPTDKTIGEDFWKSKSDVQEMVAGAYKSMISYGCQERAIMWGAYRSDELVKYSGHTNTSLDNISAVNLLPTNGYNDWSAFYSVINRCNIVLNHAPEVMENDPEFTEGEYNVIRAQMLALRSLCYFYLVRTFRDVPYTEQSYENDDQEMKIPQASPDSVLQCCIRDLEEASLYVMQSGSYGGGLTYNNQRYSDWRNVGYFTLDAVNALLADIYLWRASMNHSQADYERCIQYVDKVIESKDAYFTTQNNDLVGGAATDKYHLIQNGQEAFYCNFVLGNSRESILEWQYDGESNMNTALENYYYEEGNKDSYKSTSVLMASKIFNAISTEANTLQGQINSEGKVHFSNNDYRYFLSTFNVNNDNAEQLAVRKFVAQDEGNVTSFLGSSSQYLNKSNSRAFDKFRQNWIVYRLTDLMLMKAEAQVQIATSDEDEILESAFNLVQVVNKRSMSNNATDTLKFETYNNKESMELLVLAERERELCYEGKRWFDLVRYCYRHMEGVQANRTMYSISNNVDDHVPLFKSMLQIVARKYASGGNAVTIKMKTEPFLYWPILESETKVNKLLNQNPAYRQDKTAVKG